MDQDGVKPMQSGWYPGGLTPIWWAFYEVTRGGGAQMVPCESGPMGPAGTMPILVKRVLILNSRLSTVGRC